MLSSLSRTTPSGTTPSGRRRDSASDACGAFLRRYPVSGIAVNRHISVANAKAGGITWGAVMGRDSMRSLF